MVGEDSAVICSTQRFIFELCVQLCLIQFSQFFWMESCWASNILVIHSYSDSAVRQGSANTNLCLLRAASFAVVSAVSLAFPCVCS